MTSAVLSTGQASWRMSPSLGLSDAFLAIRCGVLARTSQRWEALLIVSYQGWVTFPRQQRERLFTFTTWFSGASRLLHHKVTIFPFPVFSVPWRRITMSFKSILINRSLHLSHFSPQNLFIEGTKSFVLYCFSKSGCDLSCSFALDSLHKLVLESGGLI